MLIPRSLDRKPHFQTAKAVRIRKAREMGWVMKISGLFWEITKVLLRLNSRIGPRIYPMIKATKDRSSLFIKYPMIAKTTVSPTVNRDLLET